MREDGTRDMALGLLLGFPHYLAVVLALNFYVDTEMIITEHDCVVIQRL